MSDPRGWPFDSPDLLTVPFIFVPHGEPEPREWLARHPGAIRIPARFVPRGNADGDGEIEADLNDALMQWLGRAAGDGAALGTQADQGSGPPVPQAGLEDLLPSGAGAGSPNVTKLDPGPLKFPLGKFADPATAAPQPDRQHSDQLPET